VNQLADELGTDDPPPLLASLTLLVKYLADDVKYLPSSRVPAVRSWLGGITVGGFANHQFGDAELAKDQIAFPPRASAVVTSIDGRSRAASKSVSVGPERVALAAARADGWGA